MGVMGKLSSYPTVTTPLISDKVPITSGGQTEQVALSSLPKAVTKTVATSSSGFVADYICAGSNDDVQIQAALNSVSSSGGGVLLIRRGTYTINAKVVIPGNVSFIGEGWGSTTIQLANGVNDSMFNIDFTNFDINIRDIKFDGRSSSQTGSSGSYIIRASNFGEGLPGSSAKFRINISNCYFANAYGGVLNWDNVFNSVINNCYFDTSANNNGEATIRLHSGGRNNVVNCNFTMGSTEIHGVYMDGRDNLVQGNIFQISSSTNAGVTMRSDTPFLNKGNRIVNNTFISSGNVGTGIAIAVSADSVFSNNIYSHNEFYLLSTAINVRAGFNSIVSGNCFNNCTTGIGLSTGNYNVNLVGNSFLSGTTAISIAGSNHINASNNIFDSCSVGIQESSASDYNILSSNILRNTTTPITVIGTHSLNVNNITS